MTSNAWMQTPAGGYFENWKFHVTSNVEAIFNPNMMWAVLHKEIACLMITTFVVAAVSAWYILKNRHSKFFLISFKMAVAAAVVIIPLQIYLGDGSGRNVFKHQPTKLAAMEAHWQTNEPDEGAPWHILAWPYPAEQKNLVSIDIPYGLSLITTRKPTGVVPDLREFSKELHPPIWLPFYGFRIMLAVGFAAFLLMLYTLWAWRKGRLRHDRIGTQRKLLTAWIIMAPLTYLAMEAGWVVREVGRQPWIIYGLLRTAEGASRIQAGMVGSSLLGFLAVYSVLFLLFVFFAVYILKEGPKFDPPHE
mgnify:CR=1 FL=1